jgi:hypothetical protein
VAMQLVRSLILGCSLFVTHTYTLEHMYQVHVKDQGESASIHIKECTPE